MLQNAKGPMRAAKANGEACEAGASYNSGAVGNCCNCSMLHWFSLGLFLFGSLALEIL